MTQNSSNQDYQNNPDGFTLGGGTTERKLTLTGGNVTVTGSGSNTYTMPASTDTLVGRAGTDTLTNKDLSSGTNTMPIGTTVQVVSTLSSAVATGTTTIPLDDTIPQITEGTEFMTLAITPKATTNTLVITVTVFCSLSSASANSIAALFQDSTANALAVGQAYQGTATAPTPIIYTHTMAAGTTSAATFRVRAGGNGASTITFNGQSGIRQFGTITKSSIVITEYKA